MLPKFFLLTVFITKCDKMTPLTFFGLFWKKLLQSVTRESVPNLRILITKFDRYFKVRENLQLSVTGFTKRDRRLLQSVTVVKKWDGTCGHVTRVWWL